MTRAFRRAALPLIAYYFVTLALPFANGAAQSGAFTTHALSVLIVPPLAIMLGYAAYAVLHAALVHAAGPRRLGQRSSGDYVTAPSSPSMSARRRYLAVSFRPPWVSKLK